MKPSFLKSDRSLLTILFSPHTEKEALDIVSRAIDDGTEAFAIQTEALEAEYRNSACFKRIFRAMGDKPIYATNYRHSSNEGVSDEEIGEGLIRLSECGATLVDVIGDMYDPQPGEMTYDLRAAEKQIRLNERIHAAGAEVLISSHVLKFLPADEVIKIAKTQQARGCDVAKIVTGASNMDEQIENLRTTALLKTELECRYLFLSGGECTIHRRLGPMLGNCMVLCSLDDNVDPKPVQPMLGKMKQIQDAWR